MYIPIDILQQCLIIPLRIFTHCNYYQYQQPLFHQALTRLSSLLNNVLNLCYNHIKHVTRFPIHIVSSLKHCLLSRSQDTVTFHGQLCQNCDSQLCHPRKTSFHIMLSCTAANISKNIQRLVAFLQSSKMLCSK